MTPLGMLAPGDPKSVHCTLRSSRGEGKYLGLYSYLYYSKRTKFGQATDHSDEIGVKDAKDDARAQWQIHVQRDDGNKAGRFMLVNRQRNETLTITAEKSGSNRQAFLSGAPAATDQQSFRLRPA